MAIGTKKERPKKVWVEKGAEVASEFSKVCKTEGLQTYSTVSDIEATIAERAIRSLKNILYRYMEDYGY